MPTVTERVKNWRSAPIEELRKHVEDTRKELVTLALKARQGAVEQPHRIRQMKRDIARVMTVLNERAHEPNKTK